MLYEVITLHVFAGYLFAGLLLFRLLWGFAGSRHSRFRDFAYGPRSVLGYVTDLLRGRAAAFVITSYSIHYTKLYEHQRSHQQRHNYQTMTARFVQHHPIDKLSYLIVQLTL